jgi:RNA polymerase sigma-70 factor, ECF subfamily
MTTEVALVRAARDGDHQAFAALVERYQRPVFSLAYRMLGDGDDAEEAAQEAFLRVYRSLAAYDFRRPFSTWLLSIAAHHCIDRLRRRPARPSVAIDDLPPWQQLAAETTDPEEDAIRADEAGRVQAGLNRLPPDYRLVLVLRYWHDFGYSDIAALLGSTESAVKSRLHRAREQLAEILIAARSGEAGRGADDAVATDAPVSLEGGPHRWNAIAPAS